MSSITHVEGVLAMSAAETAEGKSEDGATKIESGEKKRKALKARVRHLEKEQKRLQAELDDAMDTNAFEDAWNWLSGSDGGVGEIQEDMAKKAAHMKRAAHEIQVAQTEIQAALGELNNATNEFGSRQNERQKIVDEADANVAAAF